MTEKEVQIDKLVHGIISAIFDEDKSGKLLYLFVKRLYVISKLKAFDACINDEYKFVVITKDEYEELKRGNTHDFK